VTAVAVAEVAVVGGGIAGAAACVALSRCGLRALWLAPAAESGDPVGESLAPAAAPILAALGLRSLLDSPYHRRANATFSAWGGPHLVERDAIVHLEGPGLVLDRRGFETDLVAAAEAVAERRAVALARAEPTADGRWVLELADGSIAAARFLLDASGRAAVVGRRHATYRRVDRQVAATALLPHRDLDVEPTPATLIEAVAEGWWYAALLPDGRLSVAYFSDPDLLPDGLSRDLDAWRRLLDATAYVGRWIDDAGFAAEAPPRLASAGTTRLDPPAGAVGTGGAPWAAAGDAAAAFDPLSSHGMTTALWTASRAAEAAAARLADDGAPLDAYKASVAAGFENFLAQRTALYARETRFADAPFWRRRRG